MVLAILSGGDIGTSIRQDTIIHGENQLVFACLAGGNKGALPVQGAERE